MKKIKKIAGKRKEKENREKRKENEKATTGSFTPEPRPGTRFSPGRAPVARPGAPPGDTCLSRMGSSGSSRSPSRGHISLPEGLRWLAREPLPGTRGSPGRAPVGLPRSPSGGHASHPEKKRNEMKREKLLPAVLEDNRR